MVLTFTHVTDGLVENKVVTALLTSRPTSELDGWPKSAKTLSPSNLHYVVENRNAKENICSPYH